jgi:uncharacterized protein (DUF849 family)
VLNGRRSREEHERLPLTAAELALDARRAVAAGANSLHLHPRDADGLQTLAPEACGGALAAVRAAAPGVPVGVTTCAPAEPDCDRRLALLRAWQELPDFASVNLAEPGALDLCELLRRRGVGLELGLFTPADAELLLAGGLAGGALRILVEPRQPEPAPALAIAAAIEEVLAAGGVSTPQLQHGRDAAAWPVLRASLRRGHGIRIGLEDTLVLADGSRARHNTDLVAAARELIEPVTERRPR